MRSYCTPTLALLRGRMHQSPILEVPLTGSAGFSSVSGAQLERESPRFPAVKRQRERERRGKRLAYHCSALHRAVRVCGTSSEHTGTHSAALR